ncbi:hypothetical protein CR513_30922, partial [Mucuna pruriens]
MTIQLANKSVVQSLDVLEDVLVQVNELIFPADFYVLDMEDETSGKGSTLILGRPFLMIARTKIDVHVGMLLMEFGDNLVQFNMFEAMKHPNEDHSLFGIDIINELVAEHLQLEADSTEFPNFAKHIDVINCLGSEIDESDYDNFWEVQDLFDSKDDIDNLVILVVNSEMLLPGDLKYAYLDDNQQFPFIIANNLHQEQEENLLQVLRQHKKAIGWRLLDLPRINPSICMHRILMEEEACPIRQQQRRLNPTILDVVKKEVTKPLATKIIYPILDSQWVSPVQVVPKKSGMTVMKNQHDVLATRKDYFPFPFIDQVLEKLVGKSHYYFLDGFFGYMQIHIALEDQHKTTFTCPFGTFAYIRICNALSTFQ